MACYQVGLGEARYRPVDSYSAGMKQLVKLAQALVHRPRGQAAGLSGACATTPCRNRSSMRSRG